MLSIPELVTVVNQFDPGHDSRSTLSRLRTLELLGQGPAALRRDNYAPGHITASGLVLSPTGTDVLLVFHQKLRRWLQPGGHIEPADASAPAAAAREIREETGAVPLTQEAPRIVGIDVHEIPASGQEPAHLHHDLVWRFLADPSSPIAATESAPVAWCPIENLADRGVDAAFLRALRRALAN